MARALRLEFPGAVYHVTCRGERREPIYRDDVDRVSHLDVLAQATDRFDAQVLAYCLMGIHFHLVLHTRSANLSRLMRHVNGVYTQRFNRRHGLTGHLFQGRFKSIFVDRDAYLLALCRYVERNPVAAGMVRRAEDWPWSSCRAHLGLAPTPDWLDSDGLHGYLLARPVSGEADRQQAIALYTGMIGQHTNADFWSTGLRSQVFLGDEAFVQRMLATVPTSARKATEVPQRQRQGRARSIAQMIEDLPSREQALRAAYTEGGYTMTQLAQELGLSVSRVSRLISAVERDRAKDKT